MRRSASRRKDERILGDTTARTSTPPHTKRIWTGHPWSRGIVGVSGRPLLAGVGWPSILTIDQSYTVWPATVLAIRRGSTALDRAIINDRGSSTNATVASEHST